MRSGGVWLGVGLACSVAGAAAQQEEPFPHPTHSDVFPLCSSCHIGIETGTVEDYFPTPASCSNCHDGVTEDRVAWTGPTARTSNLLFEHTRHADSVAAAGDSAQCQTCHQQEGTFGRLEVTRAQPQRCLSCHTNDTRDHLAPDADCQVCHQPLAEATALSLERVTALPKPVSHSSPSFASNHAPTQPAQSTCAFCHARESCERCHLNAASLPLITGLASDARIAALVAAFEPDYPEPATHEAPGWTWRHADAVESGVATCANCHAQPSCRTCHLGAPVPEIAALPPASDTGAPGVIVANGEHQVHPAGFAIAHGPQAAANEQSCGGCHAEQAFCADCHRGPDQPGFHLSNFRERHSAEAYGAESECASCHNAEVFCRSCHAGSGLASQGQLNVAFHSARPFWLLGHGQAARQRLESCTTCHAQVDCAQCHSAVGAWRINPHGPDFDPSRVEARNRLACLQCHPTGSRDFQ